MKDSVTKPRLVFFQYQYDQRLPPFLLIHKQEHVKCLSEFFDVTVIQNDCDYEQICDTYCPDLTLFESGVNHESCQRLKIKNIRTHHEIPKLGLHHADGFCNARAGFLSDMDHWGIDTFFSISTTAAEHTPEIADNLFVWPVFVDPDTYRDYGIWKSIPVLLTGNRNAFYPWRQRVFKLLSERYPSLICPHFGYEPRSGAATANILIGDRYARTINASWCVPTCGTIAKEAVRKHFEVPGCKACLITERSVALEAAGFVDMQNCVFADGHDVLDKLAWLFSTPDALSSIIDAGYQLVHSRHTLKHRNQIFQWFNLHKAMEVNQKIIQLNPFDSPILVEKSSALRSTHVVSNGQHLMLLRKGDQNLWAEKYDEAEACYRKCINYMRWMPEPKLRMALCSLYKGDPKASLAWIEEPIQFILGQYKAVDPDPVEWAYLIISLLCLGRLDCAIERANQFPWLSHPELDRARWACNVLKNKGDMTMPDDCVRERRSSMHQLPERSTKEWLRQLCMMLKACRQGDAASRLRERLSLESQLPRWKPIDSRDLGKISLSQDREEKIERESEVERVVPLERLLFISKFKLTCKRFVSCILHRLEDKYGYFLPYHLSEMRNDEFFKSVSDLARVEKIETALVIGASLGRGSTEAFLAGAEQNEHRPLLFCIGGERRRWFRAKRGRSNGAWIKWYSLSSYMRETFAQELNNTIDEIMQNNRLNCFEAVLIDSTAFKDQLSATGFFIKQLGKARFILLDGINSQLNFDIHGMLLRNSTYELVAVNPDLRQGYAIYRKCLRGGGE